MMAAIFGSQGEAAGAEELAAQRQGFTATYREQLELLAKWCDEEGLTSQAEKTRAWLPLHHARLRYVFVPPTRLSALEPPDDLPPKEAEWLRRLAALRRAQADKLFGLAQQALQAG